MGLKEVRPIRTSERVLVELAPSSAGDAYEWRRVHLAGDRITATVRCLSLIEQREAGAVEEPMSRIDAVLSKALLSATFERSAIQPEEIPVEHRVTLAGLIFRLSTTGVDPFGEAPVGSQG